VLVKAAGPTVRLQQVKPPCKLFLQNQQQLIDFTRYSYNALNNLLTRIVVFFLEAYVGMLIKHHLDIVVNAVFFSVISLCN
jgi:hypothetical protein